MTLEQIKAEIAEIANKPNAVTFNEIERLVRHLGQNGYPVASKPGTHSHLFQVGGEQFTVCKHNPRRKELKRVYVKNFLNAMEALGLFGAEAEETK